MATLREYFDKDLGGYWSIHGDVECSTPSTQITVISRVLIDFVANVKFGAFFVPDCPETFDLCIELVRHPELALNRANDVLLRANMPDDGSFESSDTQFSGRIFLYCETQLRQSEIDACRDEGRAKGFTVHYRGPQYAQSRSAAERPLAFISHDSRDKADIAYPLAFELQKLRCPVWYDEFSLSVGDSLRESIERGLKETRKCILVITPNFLENEGWTKREFDSVFTRELLEKKNVIGQVPKFL